MLGSTLRVGDYGSNFFRSFAMVDSGFAVGMASILFLLGVFAIIVRPKWGAAMLITAGVLWLWGMRKEEGAWSLLGWLGVVVSIAGVLVYIEAAKRDILGAIRGASDTEKEGE